MSCTSAIERFKKGVDFEANYVDIIKNGKDFKD